MLCSLIVSFVVRIRLYVMRVHVDFTLEWEFMWTNVRRRQQRQRGCVFRSLSTAKHRSICRCCCSHALLMAIDISRARESFVFYTEDCLLFVEYWRLPVVTITVVVDVVAVCGFFFHSLHSFITLSIFYCTNWILNQICANACARFKLNHSIDLMKNLSSHLYCGMKAFAYDRDYRSIFYI